MSYATPPPPERVRPATVTAAFWLLILVAVLYVISAIIAISLAGTWTDIFREAFAGTAAEGTEGFAAGSTVIGGVIGLLFAAGFVVLAIFNNKGKNPSRIVTWVVGGIAVCCGGAGLLLSGIGGGMQTGGDVDQAELERLMAANLPGWYEPVSIVLSIVNVLALLVALILLALPASNGFFRKPEQPFEPPPPAYPPAS